ncbi:MAG TPA: hypothetical protein VHE61_11875, partial [Opitutaceae bacterium]|nr:hypothetical protein [Opitutaceae bacterium]
VAEADRDFCGRQGAGGWFYGERTGREGAFTLLPTFGHDDWHYGWSNGYPYLSVTATDQHPSVFDGKPVTVVRRWKSSIAGVVRVKGEFCSEPAGDGVGVSLAVDGRNRLAARLGGGNPIARPFDLTATVHPGSVIDFATDPGPGTNINSDATEVTVEIAREAHR